MGPWGFLELFVQTLIPSERIMGVTCAESDFTSQKHGALTKIYNVFSFNSFRSFISAVCFCLGLDKYFTNIVLGQISLTVWETKAIRNLTLAYLVCERAATFVMVCVSLFKLIAYRKLDRLC